MAQALSFSPPAVSQQLSVLEREVGQSLLRRTGRTVVLTAAGVELAERAEEVLASLERAEAALATTATQPSTVRLGAFPSALRPIVLPALALLAEFGPEVRVTVSEVDPAEAPNLLRGQDLDLALVQEYDNVPSVVGGGLGLEPLLDEVVYLASTVVPADPATAVREHRATPWILGNPGTLCHEMTLRTCQANGFEPPVSHRIDDFAAVLDLVATGAGVALVPELATVDVPASVHLTALPIGRRTRIAYRDGSRRRPAIDAVCTALNRRVAELRRVGDIPAAASV